MIVIYLLISIFVAFFFYRKTLPEIARHRRYILFALRAVFIFFVFLLLFNPIFYMEHRYTQRPTLLLLSDKSRSMSQSVGGVAKTELLKPFEKRIEEIYKGKGYAVEHTSLFAKNPEQSYLLDEIRDELQSEQDIRAIALVSDGWFQDNPTVFKELTDTPIHTFLPSTITSEPEIKIDHLAYNKNARRNETQTITVNMSMKNMQGRTVNASLKKANTTEKPHPTTVQQRQTVKIAEDETSATAQIGFKVSFAELGLQVYEIALESDDDLSETGFVAIQVLDHKAKILLLSDSINWDVRLWNRYLNFSERFDVDMVYFYRGSFWQAGVVKEIKWQDYSGFIIVNHSNMRVLDSDMTALKTKVVNGAGLIYIGNHSSSFSEVLPSRPTNIRIVASEQPRLRLEAQQYQIFRDIESHWVKFPPVEYYFLSPKEQTITLAEVQMERGGTTSPAIFLGHFGSGNVLHIAFSGLWRWQFTTTEQVMSGFINGLAQWIFSSNNDNFFAYTDKNLYYSGEKIIVHLSAFDERLNPASHINARVRVYKTVEDDGKETEIHSDFLARNGDEFTSALPSLPAGKYRYHIFDDISQKEASGEFEVLAQDIQSFYRGFNARLLSDLSLGSGGTVFRDSSLEGLDIPEAVAIAKVRNIEIPLHRNPYFIVVLLMCFCVELYLRKKWSLL